MGVTQEKDNDAETYAARIQLSGDDLREIDRAASRINVQGARYPEHLQQMVGR